MNEQVLLREFISAAGSRINVEASVIAGVKLIGLQSHNGRSYPPETLAQAASLYEGRPVNVDHRAEGSRSYRDRIGRIQNVQTQSDGLYGDLVVNPKHPLAEQLFWDARHSPESVGLSHDAQGKVRRQGRQVIVEEITAVQSVDLVADPATVGGLFEQTMPDPIQQPDHSTAPAPQAAVPSDVQDATAAMQGALAPQVVKIFHRTDLDRQAKLQAIGKLLDAMDRALQATEELPDAEQAGDQAEAEATESMVRRLASLQAELTEAQAQAQQAARGQRVEAALRAAGLTEVPEAFRKALQSQDDEDQLQALIEDRKTLLAGRPAGKPASRTNWGSDTNLDSPTPIDPQAAARRWTG